ncbi:iron-containing alcohol dehydrogenase [Salinibacterium sp.]|uniref:iron-containing alcohol dehydrogenase n=1 Tax=Salinibacterium sp. TaxID=1915057 RepID=UPI00286B8D42|nr:iron-containing alcohol dehydrogenase [Salinibacterium sp.]
MNSFASITDPTDLSGLRAVIANSPGAQTLVHLGIRRLEISPLAADSAVEAVEAELVIAGHPRDGAKVLIIVDSTMIRRAGQDLKAEIHRQLAARFDVDVLVLGNDAHLLADDNSLDSATKAVQNIDCVVTIGSGTITDIGKVATHRNSGTPLVVIQTSASVDGFTDNVSVVLKNGVKRTIPSRWPDVVLADTDTIADAPPAMNTAGFGEVLSLYTAPADWQLASLCGLDLTFHTTPRDLLLAFAGDPSKWALGLSGGHDAAIQQLTRVLAIRGMGTGVAGTTACLSGVEHVVSHMLDMYSGSHSLPTGLHGAQVGVASLVAAAAWHMFLDRMETQQPEAAFPGDPDVEVKVRSAFDWCDPSGATGAECWRDYQEKLAGWRSNSRQVTSVLANWTDHAEGFRALVPTPDTLARGLNAAGATALPHQLSDWITPQVWKWAVSNCHFMRNRLTVIDLLFFMGWWTDDDIDLVIEDAARAAQAASA